METTNFPIFNNPPGLYTGEVRIHDSVIHGEGMVEGKLSDEINNYHFLMYHAGTINEGKLDGIHHAYSATKYYNKITTVLRI